jgi:hypothetical protein
MEVYITGYSQRWIVQFSSEKVLFWKNTLHTFTQLGHSTIKTSAFSTFVKSIFIFLTINFLYLQYRNTIYFFIFTLVIVETSSFVYILLLDSIKHMKHMKHVANKN